MIVEGLVTSLDAAGRLNVAPMGPIVLGDFQSLLLRPFQPSTTFSNLSITRCGVFHVVDSAELIVRSVVGALQQEPMTSAAETIDGRVLTDCCRWFEFSVDSIDDSAARSQMPSSIVYRGERRSFRGFNRANHALLEAAIIATRTHLMTWQQITDAFRYLEPAVQKTGDQEHRDLFQLLYQYVLERRDQTA